MNKLEYFFSLCKRNLSNSVGSQFIESRDLLGLIDFGYCSENIFSFSWLKSKNIDTFEFNNMLDSRDKNYFSNYFNRVIIPIYSEYNELVAIAGRAIYKEQSPKYYNSIYNKKDYLFLLNKSKYLIVKNDYCVITEGYTDALRLYQYDIPSVAILSTSCSDSQFLSILKYTKNIYICLDDDKAGIKGTERLKALASEYSEKVLDLKVRSVKLSDNLDPDEYILKYGDLNFKKQIISSR